MEMVPTPDTTSVAFWAHKLVTTERLRQDKQPRPTMLVGPAGCGKTVVMRHVLSMLDPEAYAGATVSMSHYTSSAVLQGMMEGACT